MELAQDKVMKLEVLSVTDFAVKYGGNVSSQALYYAMDKDNIDFIRIGNDRFVVMTEKTKTYRPNEHKGRKAQKPVRTAIMRTGGEGSGMLAYQ